MNELKYSFSEHSLSEIATQVDQETITYFKDKFKSNEKLLAEYTLCITGTIGAGKSTLCESLVYTIQTAFPDINIHAFPEYLSVYPEISNRMLSLRLDGTISIGTFQSYILDIWQNMASKAPHTPGFRIFERCADDCVIGFANAANKDNALSDQMLHTLYQRVRTLDDEYKLPTYFNDTKFTEIKSSNINYNMCQIADIIASDISNNVFNRIIGLSVSTFDSDRRIKQRNRDGETAYTIEMLTSFNDHYTKLFALLSAHENLTRFVDIGKLY